MSSELEAVQTLFEEKHVELSAAVLKVVLICITYKFLSFNYTYCLFIYLLLTQ